MSQTFDVLIIGGGAAGITVAASLKRRKTGLNVGLIEPSQIHYYQPALTLVGAGVQTLGQNTRAELSLIPDGVNWIRDRVDAFDPERNEVVLAGGSAIGYEQLVICPGLVCAWDRVAGLAETLGQNSVSSNYSPEHAAYTWESLQNLGPGDGPAVFTQPPMPIKCPGAPQKIVYLAADYLRKKGRPARDVVFHTATPGIFGVPYFARALLQVMEEYGADFTMGSNLVRVDGANKIATFAKEGEETEVKFGMLHVTPPQIAPECISKSSLADDAGWLDVNQETLQSNGFENIFGLGDATNTPNSKTAAAVRKQSPVVIDNLLSLRSGAELTAAYDGYASCPLTTAYGKMMLAEFRYGGQVTPTIPLSPKVSRRSYWYIKTIALPVLYWNYMLKGYEYDVAHNVDFVED